MREFIDAAAFKEMILCADTALQARIQAINDLNVFPVPDGDTGTNMGLTIQNAATELRKRDFDTVAAAADCVASAMLRGARGNSGVILSLLFRGISKRLKGLDTAGPAEFTAAMNDGVEAAYKAVMKPAEGTILTVSRLASAAAAKAVKGGAVLEDALCSAIEAGDLALEDTVNQNPVLKKAGVVDAGGMGYMVILKAILSSLRGELISLQQTPAPEQKKPVFTAENVFVPEINIYDTVYVVRKRDPNVNLTPLRLYLDSIGDSLVINEDSEIFKVHVHTDIPGDALRESLKYGDLDIAKIENMRLQALDMIGGVKPKSTDDLEDVEKELEGEGCEAAAEPEEAEPEKEYGVVTVCAGEGLETLFRDLGVDQVVTGGQTMNPSTDDILRAVKATPASTVFVFPNNKNIIMAAEQCAPLTEKHVIVMPTKTVPQGISAMLNFNPDEPEESLVGAMGEAIGKVHTAMVTYAARDSDFGGHAIRAGEYLALLDGALVGSYTNLKTLFKELTWAFDDFHPEFITVYYGADVTEDDAQAPVETIRGTFPDADVSLVAGGQPVYYYMISVE
ncbi:MAG: DAK2 domain-containing protein [Oscillospiraceae bacterium]|nr:DAK2 domain-containing protein [Oscillospiraceae bacterium]